MKGTITMILCLLTFLATWMGVSYINYLCGDETVSFKQAATHPAMFLFMLVLGWIPAVVVGSDVDELLKNK